MPSTTDATYLQIPVPPTEGRGTYVVTSMPLDELRRALQDGSAVHVILEHIDGSDLRIGAFVARPFGGHPASLLVTRTGPFLYGRAAGACVHAEARPTHRALAADFHIPHLDDDAPGALHSARYALASLVLDHLLPKV